MENLKILESLINLTLPFIALTILCTMLNVFKSVIFNHINKINFFKNNPNIAFKFSYYLTLILSYFISYFGNFKFFSYLGIDFKYNWMAYLSTSFLLAGSTLFLEKSYKFIDNIPVRFDTMTAQTIRNIKNTFIKNKNENNEENILNENKNID